MSHVDEGTLHSYLDGELPSPERATVESHLAECATCRASLAEERALRERANALLGSARPVERPAPPLEQLRRETNRSPWRVRRSIAWAASIVLAIGLGYSLRGAASPEADRFALYDRRDAVAESQQEQEPKRNLAATERPQLKARASARRPAPVADEVARQSETDTAATKVALGASQPSAGAQATVPPVMVDGARAESVARKPADTYHLDAVVVTGRAATNAAPAATAPAPQARNALTEWPIITRSAARAVLGTDPVGLPGLATRRIRRSPGADSTVIVEQLVDSTTVVQIIQRATSANALSDSSPRGYLFRSVEKARADRLARFVGRLRVEITGPLSVDSLNRLLEQVAPLP